MNEIKSALSALPEEIIERKIFFFRGKRVMVDQHLSELYQVETKTLNRAVKRNQDRFPEDFMFQLSEEEFKNLRFHFGTTSHGGRRYLPFVFTEQGVAMLSSVLNSKRAVQVNIQIMRAFIKLREMLSSNAELRKKILEMEHKYDAQFQEVFLAIRKLLDPPKVQKLKKEIGFHTRMR